MFDHSGQQIVILTAIWWWVKIRQRLAVNKQKFHRFCIERFSVKKLNDIEGKRSILLRFQIGRQLWKIWTLKWKSKVLGK
jgi:hypothetical protein